MDVLSRTKRVWMYYVGQSVFGWMYWVGRGVFGCYGEGACMGLMGLTEEITEGCMFGWNCLDDGITWQCGVENCEGGEDAVLRLECVHWGKNPRSAALQNLKNRAFKSPIESTFALFFVHLRVPAYP